MDDFERKVMELYGFNWAFNPRVPQEEFLCMARAIRELVVPDGYMVVKREPDEAMLRTCSLALKIAATEKAELVIYRAMTQAGELKP
jgi:hypothetical protein